MEERVKELSKYRFENSLESLKDAKIMLENERYKNALNRGYYAIFHAIRSVNALDGFDSSKHSGVTSHFNQNYIKTGILPKELSKIVKLASENREKADYLDFFIASREEAINQVHRAENFLNAIRSYLEEQDVL
ncbi:MAG: HEPN domain-containing protein [Lachnospiraceae bacterium]|nr:HEPN domain-containing protein [Lachnospiraceae bacterium]